jgi:Flp pilus assembly pilin Flp
MKTLKKAKKEKGSVELIVIGLLAALIIVLAIPLLTELGTKTQSSLTELNTAM